jgi:predicted RNase H-like HicB family nuclease
MMEYKIVLEPDPEDGGYVVHCPALPGCYSQGDTRDTAIDNIREAIEAYLESLKMDNLPIPAAIDPEIASVRVRG